MKIYISRQLLMSCVMFIVTTHVYAPWEPWEAPKMPDSPVVGEGSEDHPIDSPGDNPLNPYDIPGLRIVTGPKEEHGERNMPAPKILTSTEPATMPAATVHEEISLGSLPDIQKSFKALTQKFVHFVETPQIEALKMPELKVPDFKNLRITSSKPLSKTFKTSLITLLDTFSSLLDEVKDFFTNTRQKFETASLKLKQMFSSFNKNLQRLRLVEKNEGIALTMGSENFGDVLEDIGKKLEDQFDRAKLKLQHTGETATAKAGRFITKTKRNIKNL